MKYTLIITLILFTLRLASQDQSPLDHFKNMHMRSIGPAVMSGRVTAIDVSERNENVIYIGSASGGLWKSESGGINWKPVFDKQDMIGIGAVCVDPNSDDIIWAGTGEGNPRNSQTSGGGIFRSPDGGNTWKKTGLENSFTIHRILVNPNNSDMVYAGVHGSAWGPNVERGVFKTSDNGKTWNKILYINDSVGCADLTMDPNNPSKLFAAMYQYQRKPYFFNSGGKGSGLHMTVDGGTTWTKLTDKNGLPEGELGRIGLAISHSNPKIVYALIECKKSGLYRSSDGGYHWELMNDIHVGDRPFYYHEIYVDPSNENHLIYLHSTVSESIDGGKTWSTLLPYSGVHPDHHAFWWSKKNPQLMMEGNDGGFNISRDGGINWTFANNLPLGQFYHINFDMETPYNIYGGMQDNGSWKGPAYVWHGGGIRAEDWQELLFGDGFDVVPRADNARYVYAMSQGGEVYYVDSETGDSRYVQPSHPEGKKLRFHWNSGIAQDPHSSTGIYFGSQFLHYSNDCGFNWQIISPDLTTNDSTKLKQSNSGGLTIDATGAENHCTILCIAPNSFDKNVIWVGTDDGNIQLTRDSGKTWKNFSSLIPGLPKNAWIPQIVSGTHSAGEALVVVNNYRQNDWKPYLFHTTDYGVTWKNIVDEKQISGHCLSIIQDPVEKKLLFLGTEHGLYVSFDYGVKWHKWTKDYPSVPTQDLKIHPREHDLIIATFGRAAYILDDIRPLRNYASEGPSAYDKKLVALKTPTAYQTADIQPLGERFPADQHFVGYNRATGAQLSYYFQVKDEKAKENEIKTTNDKKDKKKNNAEEKKVSENGTASIDKKDKKKEDKKVTIHIRNFSGDTITTFKHEPDTGINYVYWHFETKGVNYPSYQERKKDDDEPTNGISAPPGKYQVIFQFNEFKDSTELEVKYDPRLEWNQQGYEEQKNYYERLNKSVKLADSGFEQLKQAKKTIELVASIYINADDSTRKKITTFNDSLSKEIKKLEGLYFHTDIKAGYRDNSDLLSSKLYSASNYSSPQGTKSNAYDYLSILEKDVRKVADEINVFFETKWISYQEEIKKVEYSLFKEVKKL